MKLVKDRKLRLIDEMELQLYEENGKYYADAEDLHDWLQVKTRFNDWILRKIDQYKFKNEFDYITMNEKEFYSELSITYNPKGGRPKTKYFLLPDMVRQLAMVEDADKGLLVRRYYLDLEKYVMQTKQEELFRAWRIKDSENRRLLHEEIGSDTDCIRLSMTINYLVSYMRDLPTVLKKDEFYRNYVKDRDKESWPLYLDVQEKAVEFYHTYMAIGTLNPVLETCKLLIEYYVGDEDKYLKYIKNKKSLNK